MKWSWSNDDEYNPSENLLKFICNKTLTPPAKFSSLFDKKAAINYNHGLCQVKSSQNKDILLSRYGLD